MLDSLTKKLKLFSSIKCRKTGEQLNKHIMKINEDSVAKYDKLIKIMNPQTKIEYSFEFDEDEEEYN